MCLPVRATTQGRPFVRYRGGGKSNPKDWYGITRRVYGIGNDVWHRACAYGILRLDAIQCAIDSIPPCGGCHPRLRRDFDFCKSCRRARRPAPIAETGRPYVVALCQIRKFRENSRNPLDKLYGVYYNVCCKVF